MPTTGLAKSTTAPFTERFVAAFIDIIIVAGLFFFPRIGWMLGLIYHLLKESMPFMQGQSFGKHLMRIKVITIHQQLPLTGNPEKSIIRGLVMLIPILNLVDLWSLLSRGYRIADKWTETTVIHYSKDDMPPAA
ncbi:MAG: RDD family protein [Bacteroidales bacterium]|nr:RDD family protein [Bacteroidales bacterium]